MGKARVHSEKMDHFKTTKCGIGLLLEMNPSRVENNSEMHLKILYDLIILVFSETEDTCF